jgi:uncharacterized protein
MNYLLVDGHSILHAWPELAKMNRNPAQRLAAKEQLLQRLRYLQDHSGKQVVVVFDGAQAQASEEREPSGLQIFYAAKTGNADAILERLVARYAQQYPMEVATADQMICLVAEGSGAQAMSPQLLLAAVEAAEAAIRGR